MRHSVFQKSLFTAGFCLICAAPASAAFTGFHSQYSGMLGGRHIWRVFAVSNNASDVLLNTIGHTVTQGSMSGVQHNDNAGGSWVPNMITNPMQFNDSFVTINGSLGSQTALDPSFGIGTGATIPQDAGWYNSDPANEIRADSGVYENGTYRILIMQVAGATLYQNTFRYRASMTIGWKAGGTTTPMWTGPVSYAIPAPGALALVGLASAFGRRRR